jgi:hypothetical protein
LRELLVFFVQPYEIASDRLRIRCLGIGLLSTNNVMELSGTAFRLAQRKRCRNGVPAPEKVVKLRSGAFRPH